MTRTLEQFVNDRKSEDKFNEAVGGLYDQNIDTQDGARKAFKKAYEDVVGRGIPLPDFEGDKMAVRVARDLVRTTYQDRDVGDMRDHGERDRLIGEVPEAKLAKYALLTTPTENGDDRHKKAVAAHKKVIKYDGLIEKAREDYGKAAKEIEGEMYDVIKKRLDLDARNSTMTPEEREAKAKLFASLANNPQYGLQMLAGLRKEAIGKFEGLFTDESARAAYAADNIRALSEKDRGDDEKLRNNQYQAARDLGTIASSK